MAPNGKPARVALVVDNPYRDLSGIVLVASRLCEYGVTCYLVPLNLEWLEVSSLAPDFVLLTNLQRQKQVFARSLLDAGVQVGVLDSEGGVFPDLETYATKARPDRDVYDRVSCFCSWGPKLADYLRSRGWYDDEQLALTGPPRFDFYADRWREAALRTSSDVDRYASPIILITGSFPRANPCFQTPEQEIESWVALGFDREQMRGFQRIEVQAVREMAALTNHVAARFPEATVVYRPHPFEKLSTYESLLTPRDNLHLLKVGTVDGWILRASAVIHRSSTTAIEATLAGVPVFLPEWIRVAETLESVEQVSTSCTSLEDLDQRLGECLARPRHAAPVSQTADRIIRDWFHTVDGAAHDRVASTILDHLDRRNGGVRERACRDVHYGWGASTRSLASRAGTVVRKGLGLSAAWSFSKWSEQDPGLRWQGSEKRFDVAAVRTITDAISQNGSRVHVADAQPQSDYRFGYRCGHSIAMRPS